MFVALLVLFFFFLISITSSSKESYSLSQPQFEEIDMMQYLRINFPDQH